MLYHPGLDPSRVYYGTDTRAVGPAGRRGAGDVLASRQSRAAAPQAAAQQAAAQQAAAQPAAAQQAAAQQAAAPAAAQQAAAQQATAVQATAVQAVPRPAPVVPARGRQGRALLDVHLAGLAGIGLMVWRVGQYSPFLYRGGLVVLSVATVVVVAAVACPGTLVGAALGWQPLRWLGARSYGIYLWHYRSSCSPRAECGREPGPGGGADRRERDHRGPVVAVHRGAGPARRHRPRLDPGADQAGVPRWPAGAPGTPGGAA